MNPLITVRDVWRGVLPPRTELLAGGGGLERRVEWATSLRSRPPAFDAIKGGELAFVPVRSIRLLDDRLDLCQVMTSLAEKGGVAVAIVGDASAASLEVADRMMLPLLKLPDSTHLSDVQQTTVRFILDQRTLIHERQQEVQAHLMGLALAGAGTAAIVDQLSELVHLGAAWQDAEGNVLHVAGPGSDHWAGSAALRADAATLRSWAAAVVVNLADPPVREFALGTPAEARLVAPIPGRHGVGGFISVMGGEGEFGQLARMATSRAASACAIELDRERAVLQARDDLEGEFVAALLTGTYSSDEAASERGRRLGTEVSGPIAALVVRDGDVWRSRGHVDRALEAARGWARRRAPGALVAEHDHALCVVTPLAPAVTDDDRPLRVLAESLRVECAAATSSESLAVGVSRPKQGAAGVRSGYREAEQALSMGRRLSRPGRVTSFADLGLYRLLFSMPAPELKEFHHDRMGPLAAYDRRTGSGLLATLDAYFACHGSPTEMAEVLHLHRNTVLYRLRRIEEIGHLSLDDSATRLNLHLCLRIAEVLAAVGA